MPGRIFRASDLHSNFNKAETEKRIEGRKDGKERQLVAQKPCSDAVSSRAISPQIQTERGDLSSRWGLDEREKQGKKEKPHKYKLISFENGSLDGYRNLSDAMKPELRLEDSIILSTSLCSCAPPTLAALVAAWPTQFHSCQTTSVCSSAPGLSADDIHIAINLHHKATFSTGGRGHRSFTRDWQRHKYVHALSI